MVSLVMKFVQMVKLLIPLVQMVQMLPANGTTERTPNTHYNYVTQIPSPLGDYMNKLSHPSEGSSSLEDYMNKLSHPS